MKNSKVLSVILFLAGLLIMVVGAATLFIPEVFSAKHGVNLGSDINLLNDIRGAGGLMLGAGVLIMLGAFVEKMAFTSAVVGSVMYLFFAGSRMVAIALDGMPGEGLIKATVVETVVGLVVLMAFLKYRQPSQAA